MSEIKRILYRLSYIVCLLLFTVVIHSCDKKRADKSPRDYILQDNYLVLVYKNDKKEYIDYHDIEEVKFYCVDLSSKYNSNAGFAYGVSMKIKNKEKVYFRVHDAKECDDAKNERLRILNKIALS